MIIRLRWVCLVALLFNFFLIGCTPKELAGAAFKMGKVVWDPDVQVGKDEKLPTKISLSMYAGKTTNPNPDSLNLDELTAAPKTLTLEFSAEGKDDMQAQLIQAIEKLKEDEKKAAATAATVHFRIPPLFIDYIAHQSMVFCGASEQNIRNTPEPFYTRAGQDTKIVKFQDKSVRFSTSDAQPVSRITHISENPLCYISLTPDSADPKGEKVFISLTKPVTQDERALQLGEYTIDAPKTSLPLGSINQDPRSSSLSAEQTQYFEETLEFAKQIATPVTFNIVQLSEDSLFLTADFDAMFKDMKKTLGSSFIENSEFILQPGEYKYLPNIEVNKKTRYIGVFAQFHDMNNAVWKGIVQVKPIGEFYNLMVVFEGRSIDLKKEEAQSD